MSLPRLLLCLLALACAAPAAAQDASQVPTAWRLLDYIAVDYSGAVSGGKVVNQAEYAEMREFSASVHDKLEALPPNPAKPRLLSAGQSLRAAIDSKAASAKVAELARALASDLLRAYPVALGPGKAPDLARGMNLYRQNCASCHGAEGDAKTEMARQLDPPPIAFTDRVRAAERSPFAMYQVIDQGLEGTGMASFSNLPGEDKWALAFHAGSFAYPRALAREGQRIWTSDPDVRAAIPNLDALSGLSEQALAARIGVDRAGPVIAYLRAHPEALAAKAGSLALARDKLRQSLAAYAAGDREGARSLALSAYLDGFEPLEPALSAKDGALLAEVERAMADLRSTIAAGRPTSEVSDRIAAIDTLFARAETVLAADDQSAVSAFVGAFAILLREGLEALLIIVGILAFLRKADRTEMERPVHYGWVSALVAGGLTWWAATSLIAVSGASSFPASR